MAQTTPAQNVRHLPLAELVIGAEVTLYLPGGKVATGEVRAQLPATGWMGFLTNDGKHLAVRYSAIYAFEAHP